MSDPIHIDLRDLTQAHLEAAIPHLGKCTYAAPCIIGTLIPEGRRAELDTNHNNTVSELVRAGLVTLPDDQRDLAADMQLAFDNEDDTLLCQLVTHARNLPR